MDYLGRIQVTGDSADQHPYFYTRLYHSAVLLNDLNGDNPLSDSKELHYWAYQYTQAQLKILYG